MSENIIKKQHYIPRSYLRKFSYVTDINDFNNDRKNKIWVYDKKNKCEYSSTVYDIACQNYFYDIKDNPNIEIKQFFEHAFSTLEDEFLKHLNKLINCCEQKENYYSAIIINQTEKKDLSPYIAIQILRTKKVRNIINSALNNVIDSRVKFYKIFAKKCLGEKIENIKYTVDAQKLHLRLLTEDENTSMLTDFIADSNWCFFHNVTHNPFIISDNPVCRVPILDEEKNSISPFFTDKLQIYFPISPNIVIFIFRKDIANYKEFRKNTNRLIPLSNIDMVNSINQYQWFMANEKVFINPKYKYLTEEYCKYKSINNENYIF